MIEKNEGRPHCGGRVGKNRPAGPAAQLGIVHFREKASADQRHLERFWSCPGWYILQEYAQDAPGEAR